MDSNAVVGAQSLRKHINIHVVYARIACLFIFMFVYIHVCLCLCLFMFMFVYVYVCLHPPGEPASPMPEVSADHPGVRSAVEEAESRARSANLEVTPDMYMQALKRGIQQAEQRKREADPTGAQ